MSISFCRNFSGFRIVPPHAAFPGDFDQGVDGEDRFDVPIRPDCLFATVLALDLHIPQRKGVIWIFPGLRLHGLNSGEISPIRLDRQKVQPTDSIY